MPVSREETEVVGRSGKATEAVADLEVMRAEVRAMFWAFLGVTLWSRITARSPLEPPPAPVAKVSGSVLASSVMVTTTQAAKMNRRTPCKIIETISPWPPRRCQRERRLRPRTFSLPSTTGGPPAGTSCCSPGGGGGGKSG